MNLYFINADTLQDELVPASERLGFRQDHFSTADVTVEVFSMNSGTYTWDLNGKYASIHYNGRANFFKALEELIHALKKI